MTRLAILCILACLLNIPTIHGQTELHAGLASASPVDTTDAIPGEFPWEGYVLLAAGYGFLQGFRAELGWNIDRFLFAGITFGIGDYWSRDPGEGTIGFIAGFHVPIPKLKSFTPYILVARGSTVNIFSSHNDTYTFVNVGGRIPLVESVILRPELSVCFTSKIVYGQSWTVSTRNRTYPGFNVILELDL
jgi:hypothetical protein